MKGEGKGRTSGEGVKGIPKTSMFKGDQYMYVDCKAQLAYMRGVVSRRSDDLVAWVGSQDRLITEEDLAFSVAGRKEEVKSFSTHLRAQHVANTTDHSWALVYNYPGGNGLEALQV